MMTTENDTNLRHDVSNSSIVDLCCDETKRESDDVGKTIATHHSFKSSSDIQSVPLIWDFSFHGKFYGRVPEKSQIMESYRRFRNVRNSNENTSQPLFVLVKGETGVGKSALARSLRPMILKDRGYFISGKFEQTQRPEPYTAFVAALTEFSKTLLSMYPNEVGAVRNNIDKLIKREHRVLTEMAPALKNILQPIEDSTQEKSDGIGLDTVNRFKYVFRMFMRAISSKEKPIIFLLDDLHWADESSFDLLSTLLSDTTTCEGVMFVATYRIDEPSVRLQKFLNSIHDGSTNLSSVSLVNFSQTEVNDMLSESMKMDPASVKTLTDHVYHQTKGNIFFMLEYLRSLYVQNLLVFEKTENEWKWNVDNENCTSHGSLQDHLVAIVHSISEPTRDFLIYAACLGTKLDENILKHLVQGSVSLHLQIVATCGWIKLDEIDDCWRFTHDGIQEATYSMVPEEDRNSFHYRIGRKLWQELSLEEIDRYIFVVVSQLLFGIDLITKRQERIAIAKLCFRAGERSVLLSHFQNAFEYLSSGISMLDKRCWRDEYDFCLKLYNATAEVAACSGNYDSANLFVDETLQNARNFDDTIQAHITKISALGTNGNLKDAISYGLRILKNLNEPIPARFKMLRLALSMKNLKKKTRGMSDKDILQLPVMKNQSKLAAMKIINIIALYVLLIDPVLLPILALRMVHMSLDHGLNVMSSSGFILYGSFLARCWHVDEAFRFGQLGLRIFERFNIQQWTGRVYAGFYGLLNPLKMPVRASIEPLKYAYTLCLEKGDVEFACLCGNLSLWMQFEVDPLEKLYYEVQTHIKQMNALGQRHNLEMLKSMNVTIQNFLWNANANADLAGEEEFIKEHEYKEIQSDSDSVLGWTHISMSWLYYVFGHSEKAYFHAQAAIAFGLLTGNLTNIHVVYLYVGLSEIENARRHCSSRLKYTRKCIKQLRKLEDHAPSNFLGRRYLLDAELASLKKNHVKALKRFVGAIAISKESGFIFDTALAYERTAREFVRIGNITRALKFFDEAITTYQRWGSIPKVTQLLHEIKKYQCETLHAT